MACCFSLVKLSLCNSKRKLSESRAESLGRGVGGGRSYGNCGGASLLTFKEESLSSPERESLVDKGSGAAKCSRFGWAGGRGLWGEEPLHPCLGRPLADKVRISGISFLKKIKTV